MECVRRRGAYSRGITVIRYMKIYVKIKNKDKKRHKESNIMPTKLIKLNFPNEPSKISYASTTFFSLIIYLNILYPTI